MYSSTLYQEKRIIAIHNIYPSFVLYGIPMYLLVRLQSFKNVEARIIKFTRKNDLITLGLYAQNPFENF